MSLQNNSNWLSKKDAILKQVNQLDWDLEFVAFLNNVSLFTINAVIKGKKLTKISKNRLKLIKPAQIKLITERYHPQGTFYHDDDCRCGGFGISTGRCRMAEIYSCCGAFADTNPTGCTFPLPVAQQINSWLSIQNNGLLILMGYFRINMLQNNQFNAMDLGYIYNICFNYININADKKKKKTIKNVHKEWDKFDNEDEYDIYQQKIRLKRVATGNYDIKNVDKFFLEINFAKELKKKKIQKMEKFFHKSRKFASILDEICKKKNIKNNNHNPTKKQLEFECVRTEDTLPFDVVLDKIDGLINGDSVLLRYVQ